MTFALYTQFLELVVEGDAAKIRAFFAANPRISPLNPDEAEQIKARMHTPTAQGDFKGTTPLCWAAAEGSADIITTFKKLMTPAEWRRSIITPIAEGHAKGWTPIYLAADIGHADAITALIAGLTQEQQIAVITAPITEGHAKGRTPVDIAATMGHADTVTTIAALGAHTNTSLLSRGLQTCLGELDSTYKQTQVDTHITARRNELRENAKALVILGAKVPSSSWWRKKNILTEEFLQELRSLKPSPQITTSRLFNGLAFAFTRGGNSSPTATEGLHARLLGPVGERQL